MKAALELALNCGRIGAGSASVFAAISVTNNITNTSVRIALNLVLTDREEIILGATMLILEMMNNVALDVLVGFMPLESQRRALWVAAEE